jgi:hypothetical protein
MAMDFLIDAVVGAGAVLLPVAAVLLFEELTLGGLVRLLLAPRPGAGKPGEHKNPKGEGRCSH